jgi:hypothetical protein
MVDPDILDGLDEAVDNIFANVSELLDPRFERNIFLKFGKLSGDDDIVVGDTIEALRDVVVDYKECCNKYLKTLRLYRLVSRYKDKEGRKYNDVRRITSRTYEAVMLRLQQRLDQNPDDADALREKQEMLTVWYGLRDIYLDIRSMGHF